MRDKSTYRAAWRNRAREVRAEAKAAGLKLTWPQALSNCREAAHRLLRRPR